MPVIMAQVLFNQNELEVLLAFAMQEYEKFADYCDNSKSDLSNLKDKVLALEAEYQQQMGRLWDI